MEVTLLDLAKKVRSSNVEQKGSFKGWNGAEVDYYVIEGDEATLRFWNSSNSSSPTNISSLLNDIRQELLDEQTSGSLSDGWNEIMWEVI